MLAKYDNDEDEDEDDNKMVTMEEGERFSLFIHFFLGNLS